MYKWIGLPQEEGEKLNKLLLEYGMACLGFDLKAMSIEEALKQNRTIIVDEKQFELLK